MKIFRDIKWSRTIAASLLALVLISVIFAFQGVTPFGNHNLLISDMGGQYLSFFTAYRHALLNHSLQLYSFSQSLGGSVVPTVAYYLLSPFNLLILPFPAANIPTGLSLIIMVKIAAIAFTMALFLQWHYHTASFKTVLLANAYALCGFVTLNYFTIMWLDALIWLPLVILGLEHLIQTGRPGMFFGWLWLSIVTDYYLGYMTCLFVIYYFIYQLAEMRAPRQSFWQSLKMQAPLIRKVALTGFLSGLSSLFLLIPTLLGMLKTAKTAVNLDNYLPTIQFGPSVFSQLGLGANDFATRLAHAPTLFSSTLVLLLVLVFFAHPDLQPAHRRHVAGLVVALFLTMAIRTLDTAWHMFQRPAGFPYREAFFFSFVLVMIACEAWLANPRRLAPKWRVAVLLVPLVLLISGWFSRQAQGNPLPLSTGIASLLIVIITANGLFAAQRWLRVSVIPSILAVELVGNAVLNMQGSPYGNQKVYAEAYRTEYRQMQAVDDPEGQLYRVENRNTLINRAYNYDSQYRNYNDPMLFNFHDIAYYSSTFNNQTRQFLTNLGLFSKNVRRVSSEGLNPVSELLLGVKYNVTLNAVSNASTTRTASYAGMGFPVGLPFTRLTLKPHQALPNQEKILQSLRPQPQPYFNQATVLKDRVTYDQHAASYPYLHRLTLRVTASGRLFYDDPHPDSKYTTMRVNGQLVPTKFNANGGTVIRTLGTFKRGDVVQLTVKRTTKQWRHVRLASLDQRHFDTVVRAAQAQAFIPRYHAVGLNTVVSGRINNQRHAPYLYVAIPSDAGWQVRVNGRKVTSHVKTVLGGMLAVPLAAGTNQVQLVYHVPGARIGIAISLLSLLSFAGLTWRWRRI
ncbi:YfhO family protein [Lactiplantibacillus modestisalitolerans]|uniref:YfhO family protein n=1 Tax=Lactiplantibacillus modestisalitolerans TaxID=1457219 RepID=A0ABV5WVS3_9LACO|nr:YfhO family protein [Lactiplantibacillus modestisalitolerans]